LFFLAIFFLFLIPPVFAASPKSDMQYGDALTPQNIPSGSLYSTASETVRISGGQGKNFHLAGVSELLRSAERIRGAARVFASQSTLAPWVDWDLLY
jgi:hypothetical protein